MSEEKDKSKKIVDLSELQNLQLNTAWSPTTNYSKFEPRERNDFRKGGDFKRKPRTEGEEFKKRGEFKKREFKKRDGDSAERPAREPRKFDGKPGERKAGGRPQKGDFKRKAPAPFDFSMEVLFYPEDAPFAKLADVMKHLKRTYQLFDIAELVIEKAERFIVLAKNLPSEDGTVKPLYCAQPSNLPFEDEAEAKKAALDYWFTQLFETKEEDAEAPKGNFQVVNKTNLNGALLGAPNWHKYAESVREYHAKNFANMPFEKFSASIESVRDEASVTAWLEQMKKREVYKLKEGEETFENKDTANAYILEQKGAELVKTYEQVRMHGSDIALLPFGSRIRRNLEAAWAKQKRFPIVTANNLRGRLRRAGFTIYKRGSKGFAFVCAVKRKFLFEDESLSDNPQKILDYIVANQGVKASKLPYLYLGLEAPKQEDKSANLADEQKKQDKGEEVSAPIVVEPAAEITAENLKALKEVSNELLWLISEGYVVEYADSSLQANPRLPRPKDKTAKMTASDTESIALGVEDEPIVAKRDEEVAELDEEIEEAGCEVYQNECPISSAIVQPESEEH